MKNKLKLLIILLVLSFSAQSQTMFYKDSFYVQPFQRLINPTVINLGADSIWDDATFNVPLGFKFHIFNDSTNTIYFNGDINLGAIFSDKDMTTSNYITLFFASLIDLVNKDTAMVVSPISYQVSGTSPNKTCTIEWRNAGLYGGLPTDSIDIQAVFYEGSDVLELKYGHVNIQSDPVLIYPITNETGDFIGLMDSLDLLASVPAARKMYFETGEPVAPILDSVSSFSFATIQFPGLDTTVSSNSVFRFIPIKPIPVFPEGIYNVDETKNIQFQYLKDLQSATIINKSNTQLIVNVLNLNGANLQCIKSAATNTSIDLHNYASGMYFIQIMSGKEIYKVYKITK
jgi:hypothetical protein